jgi:GntR family transcriptional repressor for pyruvate dehydrogenase complex
MTRRQALPMTDIKLQKVEPVRIFEQAVEQLRELILKGALAPEEKLPTEQELSRQFHVGRSSIREALRVLESEGLVEVRRGLGAYVTTRPVRQSLKSEIAGWLAQRSESLAQLLDVRECIEGLTASLAASNATGDFIEHLRQNLAELSALVNQVEGNELETIERLSQLDASFHLMISQASGNDLAEEILAHIIPAFNEGNKAVVLIGQPYRELEEEHRAIFEAIQTRNAEMAEKVMRAHIARVRREIPGPEARVENV